MIFQPCIQQLLKTEQTKESLVAFRKLVLAKRAVLIEYINANSEESIFFNTSNSPHPTSTDSKAKTYIIAFRPKFQRMST